MQAHLSQLTEWQVELSKTSVDASEIICTGGLLQINLAAVFRPQEFLAAYRLAIARHRDWSLVQSSWRAVLREMESISNDIEAPHQIEDGEGKLGNAGRHVTVVGLHLHGAAWVENTGLDLEADEGSSTTSAEMPPILLTLVQDENQQTQSTSARQYECPVFNELCTKRDCLFTIQLPVGQSSLRWNTRGVSLFC